MLWSKLSECKGWIGTWLRSKSEIETREGDPGACQPHHLICLLDFVIVCVMI